MSEGPRRSPPLPPLDPPPKVKALANGLANGIDAWTDENPMTYSEVLQSLEWLRWCITELIVTGRYSKDDQVRRRG